MLLRKTKVRQEFLTALRWNLKNTELLYKLFFVLAILFAMLNETVFCSACIETQRAPVAFRCLEETLYGAGSVSRSHTKKHCMHICSRYITQEWMHVIAGALNKESRDTLLFQHIVN